MTQITATIDERGELRLPDDVREQLRARAGQQITVELDLEKVHNPFDDLIGILPPLDVDSVTYYRRERGHDEDDL